MTEEMRHEIVQRRQAGASMRSIAEELGISRGAVYRALARVQAQRDGQSALAPRARKRGSVVDTFEPILKELLAKYPNLTVERALQELRARGYTGGYTVLRQRVRLLRPRPAPVPVPRFETSEGQQAQMDHGVYDIDFTREGRRRVYLFSYLLGYSRRQYLRFVESMDLTTTLREHVRAFHHLGGVARVCLYDNFKAVVLWRDADGPLYNPKFLAFATHYGFRPPTMKVSVSLPRHSFAIANGVRIELLSPGTVTGTNTRFLHDLSKSRFGLSLAKNVKHNKHILPKL